MAGWHHDNADWRDKKCAVCNTVFKPTSGAHKFCSAQCKGKWQYITGVASTDNQYRKISGNWERYLARLLYYGGRKRDKLTREDLMRQLVKQNYLCALTGVPLTCELEIGVMSQTNASVDRILAGGAYTPDNIQLVCRAVNMWRCNTPVQDFVAWCRAVVDHHDDTLRMKSVKKRSTIMAKKRDYK